MAEKKETTQAAAGSFSDADKARAREWFKKAGDCRERRDYDYAIECYITGLAYWPEAVEEGHMPLRSVAIQRQQVGGKKPGLMDTMKKSMTGKDYKKAMLNAEHLLALDPYNGSYADGFLKNATKAGLLETCKFAAPLVLETLKREKKPNKTRFNTFRQNCVEAAEQAAARQESAPETQLLEQAVASLDYLAARMPGDETIRNELRDLAGRLTIARGKYEQADTFRDSLQDADKQKLLHDSERGRQGEETLDALIEAARKEFEAAADVPAKINAYVDALLKAERKKEEDRAIEVLLDAHQRLKNYSYKQKADDVRMTQLRRQTSQVVAKARKSGTPEDKQQARLAGMELRQVTLEIFRERVEKYPTDLRHKFKLGGALFDAGEYDEAIPVLQAAQQDPRYRVRCQLLLGRSFFEKKAAGQAVELLKEAIGKYEFSDDTSKELLYWLGRALEANRRIEEAKEAYGRLLRQDYNYRDGDARKRLEQLTETGTSADKE